MRARTDLRLAPAAAAGWGAALVGTRAAPADVRVVLGAVVTVAVVLAAAGWLTSGRVVAQRLRAVVPGAVVALAVAAAVLGSALAQRSAQAPALVRETVAAGTVGVRAVVLAAPQPLGVPGGLPARVRVEVEVREVTAAGGTTAVALPAVVLAPSGAEPGSVVAWEGAVHSPERGDREVLVLVAADAPVVLSPPSGLRAWASGVRAAAARLAQGLPGDARALLPAVTVGDTAGVPSGLREAMRVAGLSHVMAVSGAHFTLVGGLLAAAAAGLRTSTPVRAAVVLAGSGLLVVVVQPEPSVARAAVQGAVGVLGLLIGRRAPGPAALAGTVVVLMVADPWLAGEPGAALSVAATGGLVLLGPPLVRRWAPRCGRAVATALAAPVAAQLGCAPLVLTFWPTLSTWAVVANVVVAPAVAPATVLGLGAALVEPWWPGGARVVAAAAGAACWWVGAVARAVAQVPGSSMGWASGWAGAVCACVATAACVRLLLLPPRRTGAGTAVGAVGAVWQAGDRGSPDPDPSSLALRRAAHRS